MPSKAAGSKKTTKKATKKTAKKRTKTTTRAATKPAAKAAPTRSKGTRLRVRQVRSEIGHADTYRRTLRALGIRHHQDEVVIADDASARGMLHKVRHLVRVTPEEA